MGIIWFVLIMSTLITIIAEKSGKKYFTHINHESQIHYYTNTNKMIFATAIILLITIAGLRSSIGDTGYYLYSFKILPNSIESVISDRDWGYSLYSLIIKNFFPHPQFILIFTSAITISLIARTLYKLSVQLSFSIFLFITSGIYISTMNGARQYLVAAVLFSMISLITQGNKRKYFIAVLFLSTVHNSALVMIPIYFVVRQKAWSKKIIILIIAFLIAFISFDYLFNIFSSILRMTQYGYLINTFGIDEYSGTSLFRIAVAAVPVILGYLYRKKLSKKMENYNIFINFSILNLIVLIFASYNSIFARLGIYFGLYNLILLPGIFYYCFDKNLRALIMYLAIVCYLIFFYYEVIDIVYASYFLNINKDLIGPLTNSLY